MTSRLDEATALNLALRLDYTDLFKNKGVLHCWVRRMVARGQTLQFRTEANTIAVRGKADLNLACSPRNGAREAVAISLGQFTRAYEYVGAGLGGWLLRRKPVPHKVPARVIVVDQLRKMPTAKIGKKNCSNDRWTPDDTAKCLRSLR